MVDLLNRRDLLVPIEAGLNGELDKEDDDKELVGVAALGRLQ